MWMMIRHNPNKDDSKTCLGRFPLICLIFRDFTDSFRAISLTFPKDPPSKDKEEECGNDVCKK